MKIELKDFNVSYVDQLNLDVDPEILMQLKSDNSFGKVLLIDGEIAVCAAIIKIPNKTGICWLCRCNDLTNASIRIRFTVIRETKKFLKESIESGEYKRIEAQVYEGDETNKKWIKALGFKIEGKKKNFGDNGETILLYSILPEGI